MVRLLGSIRTFGKGCERIGFLPSNFNYARVLFDGYGLHETTKSYALQTARCYVAPLF